MFQPTHEEGRGVTTNRVDRLIIADSMPVMHPAVNEVQRRGPADLLRFPDIVQILAGGVSALQRCILDQIATCRELHGISEIAVVAYELTGYNHVVGNIGRMLKGTWRFKRVTPILPASELAPGIVETWKECMVTCVDFRPPFAEARDTLRQSHRYEIAIPGAAKQLLEEGSLKTCLLQWLVERRLRVEVLQHEDCGAYGPELHADSPAELVQHRDDVVRFAMLAEMHGVRFVGGRLIRLDGTTQRF